jgi:hypothetical protein
MDKEDKLVLPKIPSRKLEDQEIDYYKSKTPEQFWASVFHSENFSEEEAEGPYWLATVKGSLAEERRVSSPKNYKKEFQRLRALKSAFEPINSLEFIEKNSEQFNIKLAQLLEAYPDVNIDFQLQGWDQKVDTNKKLRSFLIFFIQKEKTWINTYLEIKIEKFLRRNQLQSIAFRECLALWRFYLTLDRLQIRSLLEEIYQASTLKNWEASGSSLFKDLSFRLVDSSFVRESKRRRGYAKSNKRPRLKLKQLPTGYKYNVIEESTKNDKEGNPYKYRKEEILLFKDKEKFLKDSMKRRIIDMEESEIRARILKKQLLLFERQLDTLLELQSPLFSKEEKRKLFRDSLVPEDRTQIEEQSRSEVIRENLEKHL